MPVGDLANVGLMDGAVPGGWIVTAIGTSLVA
jgi:hypothetical protein